jgi:hypothetical protein
MEKVMTINRIVFFMAGLMVLLSVVLTQWHHPDWKWLTVFVGANLFQSSITKFCPLALILKRLGVPE